MPKLGLNVSDGLGDFGLELHVAELRDGDRGEHHADGDHDDQLDQAKPTAPNHPHAAHHSTGIGEPWRELIEWVAHFGRVIVRVDPDAEFLPELTHLQAIERGLKVMDSTALSLCMDNNLPIHVFALADGNIRRVVAGERVGTLISTPAKEER